MASLEQLTPDRTAEAAPARPKIEGAAVWNLNAFAGRLGTTQERIRVLLADQEDSANAAELADLLERMQAQLPQHEEGTW